MGEAEGSECCCLIDPDHGVQLSASVVSFDAKHFSSLLFIPPDAFILRLRPQGCIMYCVGYVKTHRSQTLLAFLFFSFLLFPILFLRIFLSSFCFISLFLWGKVSGRAGVVGFRSSRSIALAASSRIATGKWRFNVRLCRSFLLFFFFFKFYSLIPTVICIICVISSAIYYFNPQREPPVGPSQMREVDSIPRHSLNNTANWETAVLHEKYLIDM